MIYELYYFIPWPKSQDLLELDSEKVHWSYSDCDFDHQPGCFVQKEWWDSIQEQNGFR